MLRPAYRLELCADKSCWRAVRNHSRMFRVRNVRGTRGVVVSQHDVWHCLADRKECELHESHSVGQAVRANCGPHGLADRTSSARGVAGPDRPGSATSTQVGTAAGHAESGCAPLEEIPTARFGRMFLQETELGRRFVIDRLFITTYNSRRHDIVTRSLAPGVEAGLRRITHRPRPRERSPRDGCQDHEDQDQGEGKAGQEGLSQGEEGCEVGA